MRFHCLALVCGVIFLFTKVDAASTMTDAKLSTTAWTYSTPVDTVPTKRLLRGDNTETDGSEERAFNINAILGLKKVTNFIDKKKAASWLKKGKVADDVFAKLKLSKVPAEKLFENPKFIAWANYVSQYDAKYPEKATTVIPTLTKTFGDDVVAKTLEAATKVAGSKKLASSLQTQQLEYWKSLEMSADDVFRALKLNGKLDDVLTDPNLLVFNKYMIDFNTWNQGKSTTMVETLSRSYGDAAVSKMLEKATEVAGTKDMATRLQNQQMQTWKDKGLDVDDIYKALKLDSKAGNVFENPNFVVWTKYTKEFGGGGGDDKTFDLLWKMYDEEKLAKMLVAPRETRRNSIVNDLQKSLITKWLAMDRKPDDVAEILGTSFQGKTLTSLYRWNYKNQVPLMQIRL